MIHRREFENKLTKELLKIVHYNYKNYKRRHGRLPIPQEDCSTNLPHWLQPIYKRCPYDYLILGNFKFLSLLLVPLQQTALNLKKPLCSVAGQQTI